MRSKKTCVFNQIQKSVATVRECKIALNHTNEKRQRGDGNFTILLRNKITCWS